MNGTLPHNFWKSLKMEPFCRTFNEGGRRKSPLDATFIAYKVMVKVMYVSCIYQQSTQSLKLKAYLLQ